VDQRAAAKEIEQFAAMDNFLKNLESLGDFLAILFHNRVRGETDPRGLSRRFSRDFSEDIPISYPPVDLQAS
jgi:CHASE1-domain containing sensor protein